MWTSATDVSETAVNWLEQGLALQRAGRGEEALASFERAVAARHDDVEALVGQGQTHH